MNFHGSLLLFADDFDAAEAAPLPPPSTAGEDEPALPQPSYDQAALEAACALARAEGHAQGLADAAAADAARVAETLASIGVYLSEAAAQAARATEEAAVMFARLLLSSMLAGYPRLGERHGAEELRALLRHAMSGLLQEPHVTFHVHPSMVDAVTGELAAIPAKERAHMTIEPWDAIPPGDTRVTWPNGALVRDTVAVASAIADILRPLGLLPEPEPDCADAVSR
jgi:hypothetical protein